MKLADITKKNDLELVELVTTSRQQLTTVVIDSRTKEVKNVKQIAALKRIIARALTIQREREIAAQEQVK
jgi:ribosomal protein L29